MSSGSSTSTKDDFLKVMLRWLNAFVSKPGQTIPGVEDELFDRIQVPTLIIRGGENDMDHPKRTSLEVSCLIKGSKLIDPPWPEDAWERASEDRAAGRVKHFNMFDTWVQAAPADPRIPGLVKRLLGADVDLAVQRRLECCVDPAFRNSLEVCFTQRHVDDVETFVIGIPHDLAAEPEAGQHAVGVVVGSPADEGNHPGAGVVLNALAHNPIAACLASSASSPAMSSVHVCDRGSPS